VHILVFLLAKNAYFIILSAYFDCIFRNFLMHKRIVISNLHTYYSSFKYINIRALVITDDIILGTCQYNDTRRSLHINCSLQNFGFLYKTVYVIRKLFCIFFVYRHVVFLRPCSLFAFFRMSRRPSSDAYLAEFRVGHPQVSVMSRCLDC